MSALTATRQALAVALRAAGVSVVDHEPDRPAPPQVIVALGSPSVSPGDTYATRRVTYRLLCTERPGSASKVLSDLESTVEKVAAALDQLDDVESWSAGEPVSLISGQDAIPCIEITTTLVI